LLDELGEALVGLILRLKEEHPMYILDNHSR
jgi:hypothetical protein